MTARICIIIDDKFEAIINCFDTSIGTKYPILLAEHLEKDLQVDHTESFSRFLSEKELQNLMFQAFNDINSFFKKQIFNLNEINLKEQETFNNLHKIFETLNGQWDKPSKLMTIAPAYIKEAIRRVNWCVHLLESSTPRNWVMFWNKNNIKRIPFTKEDYDLVEFTYKPWTVYMSYNEVGKDLRDLFKDNLPLNYSNLKNNHFLGPDILPNEKDTSNVFEKNFINWSLKNNIDLYDKTLGIGAFPVGKYTQNFNNNDLSSQSRITKIEIND